jgi:hypothetical protein
MIRDKLKEIGIVREGNNTRNGSYVIDIEDSDDFGRFYSLLDKSPKVEELDDNTINNIHTVNLIYLYDNLHINLTADFDEDIYKVVVKDIGKEEEKVEDDDTDEDTDD